MPNINYQVLQFPKYRRSRGHFISVIFGVAYNIRDKILALNTQLLAASLKESKSKI